MQKPRDILVKAFRNFGVATYAEPEPAAPVGDMGLLWRPMCDFGRSIFSVAAYSVRTWTYVTSLESIALGFVTRYLRQNLLPIFALSEY